MQASKVKIGETYGINRNGQLVGLVVASVITEKTDSSTSSFVSGVYAWTDGTRHRIDKLPVKDLQDEFGVLEALAKARAERDAAVAAKKAIKLAKQTKAVTLLAKVIGARAVYGSRYDSSNNAYDKDVAMVHMDGPDAIEINGLAWDDLIAYLERNLEEDGYDGMGNPLDGGPMA